MQSRTQTKTHRKALLHALGQLQYYQTYRTNGWLTTEG